MCFQIFWILRLGNSETSIEARCKHDCHSLIPQRFSQSLRYILEGDVYALVNFCTLNEICPCDHKGSREVFFPPRERVPACTNYDNGQLKQLDGTPNGAFSVQQEDEEKKKRNPVLGIPEYQRLARSRTIPLLQSQAELNGLKGS